MKRVLLAFAAMVILAGAAARTEAQTPPERPEAFRIGSWEVYVLQENASGVDARALIGASPEALARYAPEDVATSAVNAILIRRDDSVYLVDTGYGDKIFDQMASLGITPEDVDGVFATHLHEDHIGGLVVDGLRVFPNATLSLSGPEFDFWSEQSDRRVHRIFELYGDDVRILSPVGLSGPYSGDGITPVAAYGHTPGHTMYVLSGGGEQLLIWGDLVHAMSLQMPHPEVTARYDVDQAAARATRSRVLAHFVSGGPHRGDLRIIGMHIVSFTPGHLFSDNSQGYLFLTRLPD